MADTIDIVARAVVTDLASGAIKGITGAIGAMGGAAAKASAAVSNMSSKMAGTVGQMVGGLGRAGGEVEGFGKKIASMFGPLQGLTSVASLGGLTAAVVSFANAGVKLDEMAHTLHVTAGMLEAFEHAAGGPEHADEALKHLHETMAGITAGGKDTESVVALMHKFGVTAKEIADGNLETILPQIAAGFAANTDPALRSRMALALFGAEGERLIPFLARGPAGVRELTAEMNRLGKAAHLPEAHAAADALAALSLAVTDAKDAIGAAIAPAFTPMVEVITKFVNANQDLLKQVALPAFIGLITTSFIALAIALWGVLGPFELVIGAIAAAGIAIYQNWDKVKAFFDSTLPGFLPALQQAGAGIAAWAKDSSAKISEGFKTGGISGGLNAIWDVFKTGGESAFTWIVNKFNAINWTDVGNKAATLMWQAMVAIFNAEVSLGQFILDKFNKINWGDVGKAIVDGIQTYFQATFKVMDWLRGLDWKTVGHDVGVLLIDAIALIFRTAFKVGEWIGDLDWSKIGLSLAKYFLELTKTLVSIGSDIIKGLIDGMMEKIPGLKEVVDAAKALLGGIGDAWNSVFSAENKGNINAGIGRTPAPGTSPRLLAQPGAATPTQKVESNAKVLIGLEAGLAGKVVSSETTGNGKADIAVGNSGMATPVH